MSFTKDTANKTTITRQLSVPLPSSNHDYVHDTRSISEPTTPSVMVYEPESPPPLQKKKQIGMVNHVTILDDYKVYLCRHCCITSLSHPPRMNKGNIEYYRINPHDHTNGYYLSSRFSYYAPEIFSKRCGFCGVDFDLF
jgi:hypothetical protein